MDAVHSSSKSSALVLLVLGLVFKDHVQLLSSTAQENDWQVYSVNFLTSSSSLLMGGRINSSVPGTLLYSEKAKVRIILVLE